MDVRRLHLVGVDQQLGHQPDDRGVGVLRGLRLAETAVGGLLVLFDQHVGVGDVGVAEEAVDLFGFVGVVFGDLEVDLPLRSDDRVDVAAEQIAQRVERLHIGRVAHGDGEQIVVLHHRHHPVVERDVAAHGVDHLLRNIVMAEVEQFHAVLLCEHGEQLLLLNDALLLENVDRVDELLAVGGLLPGLGNLLRSDHAVLLKQPENVFGISGQNPPPVEPFSCKAAPPRRNNCCRRLRKNIRF